MKNSLILLIIIFLCTNVFSEVYYVDFSGGNDNNDGQSVITAWKTLYKVNNSSYSPGDSILFKRCETWRGQLIPHSGDATGYILYGSYGDPKSSKPMILGSVEGNDLTDWVNIGSFIWEMAPKENTGINCGSVSALKMDVGNLIFNNGEECGVKVWKEADLNRQGRFWHDAENSVVKLFSVCHPAKYYNSIELALKRHIIDEGGKSYVRYEDLELRYGAAHGIGGGEVHHIIIKNCDLSFIGGALQYFRKERPVRYGNGIEFWNNAHDCYVIGCKIWDIYDAALTNQGEDNVEQYNIYYWDNIIWNSEYSFEYWLGNNSIARNIIFENNTCVLAGNGFGHFQRPDSGNGRHLMFYSNRAAITNFSIRNNIFSESTESAIRLASTWIDLENLDINYNLYFESSGDIANWQGNTYSFQDYKEFQKNSGKDKSSAFVDPCFKNPKKYDFRLSDNSPVKNTGIDTGNFQHPYRDVCVSSSKIKIGTAKNH